MTRRLSIAERIREHSQPDPSTGCREWTRSKRTGYGIISVGGKLLPAHRVAWELNSGPIPEGMVIDHACSNKSCVEVTHLRLATYSQNNSHINGPKRDNTSGHRNLFWDKAKRRWRVLITKDGKRRYYGRYADLGDALAAAERARQEVFGEFAGTA